MRVLRINLMSLSLLSICLGAVAAHAQERIAIKAGRLIDGTGAPAIEKAVIIVHSRPWKLSMPPLARRQKYSGLIKRSARSNPVNTPTSSRYEEDLTRTFAIWAK